MYKGMSNVNSLNRGKRVCWKSPHGGRDARIIAVLFAVCAAAMSVARDVLMASPKI
jgi:hypothetical protein